jgi:hypothetical protein
MKTLMFFVSFFAIAANLSVEAAPKIEGTVAVRTYDYARVPRQQLATARAEAERIFRNARIEIQWVECKVPESPDGAACTEPLAAALDLMLRLIDRAPDYVSAPGRVVALGESLVDREERGGVLMTVDLSPVRTIADRAATGMPILLGRAIAHEIGHLLLGSADHSRLGLMRALWSHDELRGLRPANWGFSSREATRMRQTLRLFVD